MEHELNTFFHRSTGKFDQLVTVLRVDRHHGIVGASSFFEVLLAFAVLLEDFLPGRRDEDAMIVAKVLGSVLQVSGDRETLETQIAENIGHTTVEENDAGRCFGKVIVAHLPAKHEFSEERRIFPRQRGAIDRDLIPNDRASSLDGARVSELMERFDEGALA